MKYSFLLTLLITVLLITNTASAELSNDKNQVEHYQEKLDKISFLPRLLPAIIENSDAIELTGEQLETLLEWRKANKDMLAETESKIVQKRFELEQAALSPEVSSARLIQMQNEIFRLQRAMLEHKLSCRELVINTFNRNNWESFFLILADKEMGITLPESYLSQW